jgi:type IV pilus assembly protein PilA
VEGLSGVSCRLGKKSSNCFLEMISEKFLRKVSRSLGWGQYVSRSTPQANYRKGESMLRFFAKRLKELQEEERDERGFTLIELLVVIIIIGVLAAIAIPVFLAQREKAWEAAAKSDLRNAAAAATSCSANNDGSFLTGPTPCNTLDNLTQFGYNKTDNPDVDLTFVDVTDTRWHAMTETFEDDGTTFEFDTEAPAGTPQGQVYCTPGAPDCAP